MGRWLKNNYLNLVIAGVISVPLVMYAKEHQEPMPVVIEPAIIEEASEVVEVQMCTEAPSIEPVEVVLVMEPETETEQEPEIVSLGEFRLTAYCSCAKCCGKWAKNRPVDENGKEIVKGASGAVLKSGTSIAVDPKVIPYGTKVIINDHEYIAQDCGGAIKNNRIDVYFDNHEDACNFGLQYAEVFVEGGEY